ncbi:hypothetical protein RHODOSMS8_02981 [Rhodobiaceae bacterium]|nr:hypothetical protein RHODOSMS8_02981 [Rhodobiaceae bacterium]
MTNTELVFAIASPALTIFGFFLGWFSWRRRELRRDEVLSWADDCIECLQTLLLISLLRDPILSAEKIEQIRLKVIFDTSILIERGRLFFKNEVVDDFGSDKLSAYRGYRPRILDHLVVGHQIARFWPDSSDDDKRRRTVVARNSLKGFVSLAQKEVGRDRAASAEALRGGDGVKLSALMAAVKPEELD